MLSPDEEAALENNYGGGGLIIDRKPLEYSAGAIRTLAGQLPAPQNFRGFLDSPNAVWLSWNPVAGAAGYKVWRDGYAIDVGNVLTYPIGSLPAGSNKFWATAYGAAADSESPASNQITFQITLTPSTGAINTSPPNSKRTRTKIIVRPNGNGSNLPARTGTSGGGVSGGGTRSGTGTATTQPAPSAADELLFGYPKNTVLIVGGVAAVGLLMYFGSGKK
jgi:hypothetical protein